MLWFSLFQEKCVRPWWVGTNQCESLEQGSVGRWKAQAGVCSLPARCQVVGLYPQCGGVGFVPGHMSALCVCELGDISLACESVLLSERVCGSQSYSVLAPATHRGT